MLLRAAVRSARAVRARAFPDCRRVAGSGFGFPNTSSLSTAAAAASLGDQQVFLNYQEPPPEGKGTGRYIDQDPPEPNDLVDETVTLPVTMGNARALSPAATLESKGFELRDCPTSCKDFFDDQHVVDTYYEEMMDVIKEASGAERVFVFDHTVRETGNTNLNAIAGGSAAPVPRVHCDYTAHGAPLRLKQLGKSGIYSRIRGRELSEEEVDELASGRFAFINVWRSISDEGPVQQQPLAVADENSIPEDDRFLYELRFPDRTGSNYRWESSCAQ